MKVFVIIMCLFLGSFAWSSDYDELDVNISTIRGIGVSQCHWIPINDKSGRNAYACTSYPRRANVADFHSTASAIQRLETKITQLQSRIAELEFELSK